MATEKRLIDANALMDVIRKHEYPVAARLGSIDNGMFTVGIQQAVDEQPTVDAVEVIRCKDCKKWFRHTEVDRERGECRRYQTTKHEAGFCDRGERKDNVL